MAITQKSRWDDTGQEPPIGEAKYTAGEQPIAEYDNWFNKAVVDDIAALNQWLDNLGITKVYFDTEANKPASGATTELFIATDTNKIYRGTGTGWQELTVDWNAILNKPSLFPSAASVFTVDGSLIPDVDRAHDLGSDTNRFREIRAKRAYINGVIIDDYDRLRGTMSARDVGGDLFNLQDINDLAYFADYRFTVTTTPAPVANPISNIFENHARYAYSEFDTSPVTIEIDLGGTIHYWRGCFIHATKNSGDPVDEIKVEYLNANDGSWYEYASITNSSYLIHNPHVSTNNVSKWRITITATLDSAAGDVIRVRQIRLFNFYILARHPKIGFPFLSARGGYLFDSILPYPDNAVDLGSSTERFANIYAANVVQGDAIFSNEWRITEYDDNGEMIDGLIFKNKQGEEVLRITNDGLYFKGQKIT